ncbi:MAG: hypothetical protein AAF658_13715, partial [Myxococcota bacterium]
VPKTYLVKLRGRPEPRQLDRLRAGVRLKEADGSMSRPTKPANVVVVKESPANTWVELTIFEGRHHQVKRMCESIGHGVLRLVRTDFAGVPLDDLPTGAWRFLKPAEVAILQGWITGETKVPKVNAPTRGKAAARESGKRRPDTSARAGTKEKSKRSDTRSARSKKRKSGPKKGKGTKTRGRRRG